MASGTARNALGMIAASALLFGCAGSLRYMTPGTEKAVGADAEIIANVDSGQNITRFDVHATHLPPPGRLADGADTFVVWVRRDNTQPFLRVGTLRYDPNAREGDMKDASVPETAFQLIVSAESGPFPGAPSQVVAFEQVVER